MSPHQIIAVAVRLSQGEADSILVFVVGAAIVALFALALWKFPLTVVRKLLSSIPQKPEPQQRPDSWLAMGSALIGLWLLSSTVPSLIQTVVLHFGGFKATGTSSWVYDWGQF